MINFKKKILFLFFCALSPYCWGKNIICDLGGVLIDTNTTAAFWYTGPFHYLRYFAANWPYFKSIKSTLFDALDTVKIKTESEYAAQDEAGRILPEILCDWLRGTISSKNALETIQKAWCQNEECFSSEAESQLIHNIVAMMFDPVTFIDTRILIPSGIHFLQECKEQGHCLYLLSNWDFDSFEELTTRFPDLISLFDGIVISGEKNCGYLKPDPNIYHYFLNKFKLNPVDCIFIDDQWCNVISAQKCGIASILCQRKNGLFSSGPDFDQVRIDFQRLTSSASF